MDAWLSLPLRDWNAVFRLALNTAALAPRKGSSPSKEKLHGAVSSLTGGLQPPLRRREKWQKCRLFRFGQGVTPPGRLYRSAIAAGGIPAWPVKLSRRPGTNWERAVACRDVIDHHRAASIDVVETVCEVSSRSRVLVTEPFLFRRMGR